MAVDLALICTDSDLLNRAGSERVKRGLPGIAERDAARAEALREVLNSLSGRSPPIYESDIADQTELREMVMYRALQIIMQNAAASADSVHGYLAHEYGKEYASVSKRSIKVSSGFHGPSGGTFRLERR